MARNRGCCVLLHLHEDNARFLLLMVVMTLYMLFGATVFMLLERDKEIEGRNSYQHYLKGFLERNDVNLTDLEFLLDIHAEAASAGIIEGKRPRWDFAGAFYFVGTVVSTIGKLTLFPNGVFVVYTWNIYERKIFEHFVTCYQIIKTSATGKDFKVKYQN